VIGIVDYGMGNLASVANAFEYIGFDSEIFDEAEKIDDCERLVLPGVGSFNAAMETLVEKGWDQAIVNYASSGRPVLGICLGMQLLFESGDEHGPTTGLGLIPGEVKLLEPESPNKVPHVGWNSLISVQDHPLLERYKPGVDLYFVHSYQVMSKSEEVVIAKCDFGGEFVSAVAKGNVAGMQFHPEKSQPYGLKILENFVDWEVSC
jgi:glutamine amidotransferase